MPETMMQAPRQSRATQMRCWRRSCLFSTRLLSSRWMRTGISSPTSMRPMPPLTVRGRIGSSTAPLTAGSAKRRSRRPRPSAEPSARSRCLSWSASSATSGPPGGCAAAPTSPPVAAPSRKCRARPLRVPPPPRRRRPPAWHCPKGEKPPPSVATVPLSGPKRRLSVRSPSPVDSCCHQSCPAVGRRSRCRGAPKRTPPRPRAAFARSSPRPRPAPGPWPSPR
mmetsp:Transcript_18037/g.58229  ORF Transcript_18037/g.58229 Transcript_18037/m.58229 type:complete len:223 (+) Transcript_18037:4946-5614(+)